MLDNVYLNGIHALKQLELRNTTHHSVLIKLRSNLSTQIAFQLSNENLSNFDGQHSQHQQQQLKQQQQLQLQKEEDRMPGKMSSDGTSPCAV